MMQNDQLLPYLLEDRPTQQLLQQQYGVDLSQAELLKSNFNLVFGTETLIIRFSPASKKGLKEIKAELKWLLFLTERGILVNSVQPSKAGEPYLETVVQQETLYCVVFERSQGNTVKEADWTPDHFRKVGAFTGRLHRASLDFHDAIDDNFIHWWEQSKCAVFSALPQDQRGLPAVLKSLNEQFAATPRSKATYGVIHYDIHHENYFLLRDQPGEPLFLFDFEMTCRGWYLQDIAVILYYASNRNTSSGKTDRASFEAAFLAAFREGYQQHVSELVFDEGFIQAQLLYRDLLVYAYVLDVWQGRTRSEGDQRFLDLLEANIAERSANYRSSDI